MQKNNRLRFIRAVSVLAGLAGLSAAISLPSLITQAQTSPTPSDSTNSPDNLTPSPTPGLTTPSPSGTPSDSTNNPDNLTPSPNGGLITPSPSGTPSDSTNNPDNLTPSPTPSSSPGMSPSPTPSRTPGMMSPTPRPTTSPTPSTSPTRPTPTPSTSPTRPTPTPTPSTPSSSRSLGELLQQASTAGSYRTLARILQETGLGGTLQSQGGNFTILAPTDEAFSRLPAGTLDKLLRPENRALLGRILGYHVIPGEVTSRQFRSGGVSALSGGVAVRVTPERIIVNDGSVVQPDIQASNGVIHGISRVLMSREVRQQVANLR